MLQTAQSPSKQIEAPNDLITSVQRSFQILELLAVYPDGLNAKQISLKSGLNLSTCYHLINTLMACGYVIKDPDSLLFRKSNKIGYTELDQIAPCQLVRQLTPHVETLRTKTNETAYLSVWDQQEIILSVVEESPLSVRVKALEVGFSEAGHATALGKAILANLTASELEQYLSAHVLTPYTMNTITDIPQLKTKLDRVQKQGYSLDIEEYLPDVCCIGAAIFDSKNRVCASLAIALPSSRYKAHRERHMPTVIETAARASRMMRVLGHTGSSVVA